jgi:hypothetical protein
MTRQLTYLIVKRQGQLSPLDGWLGRLLLRKGFLSTKFVNITHLSQANIQRHDMTGDNDRPNCYSSHA